MNNIEQQFVLERSVLSAVLGTELSDAQWGAIVDELQDTVERCCEWIYDD